jgi:hypothetical protein
MNSVDSVFGLRIMMFSVGFKWLCPLNDPVDASDDSPCVAMCNGVLPKLESVQNFVFRITASLTVSS